MKPYSTRHHGHNIPDIHHEVLCDYTHRLNEEYDTLPLSWIEYFKVRINNLIAKTMHWRNTYNLSYDRATKKITITGFPTYTIKRGFKIGEMQTDYTLHKMDYKQAIIYVYGKNYVKIEFLIEKKEEDPCVVIEYLQSEMDSSYCNDDYDCNILTESHTNCECKCCGKKEKEECYSGQHTNNDDGNNESTDSGNDEPTDNNGDNDSTIIDDSILYP